MYLKTHSLDLKPKIVNTDPMNIKRSYKKVKFSQKAKLHEYENRKFPKLLYGSKIYQQNNDQSSKKNMIKYIEKQIKTKKEFFDPQDQNQEYFCIQEKKIHLDNNQKLDQELKPISKEQKVQQLYHKIFVLPKQKEIEKISEEVKQKYTIKQQTVKEKLREQKINQINEDIIENPQFIVQQHKKKSRLLSAFSKNTTSQKQNYENQLKDEQKILQSSIKKLRIYSGYISQSQENKKYKLRAKTAYQTKKKNDQYKIKSANVLCKYGKLSLQDFFKQQLTIDQVQQEGLILNRLIEVQCQDPNQLLTSFSKKQISDKFIIKYLHKNIKSGIYFKQNKNYEKALVCFKKVFNKINKKNQKNLFGYILNQLGFCYYELKNYNSAYQINLQILELEDQQHTTIALYNLIRCSDQINNIYFHEYYLKQYEQHLQNLQDSSLQILLLKCQQIIFFCKVKQSLKAKELLQDLKQYKLSKEFKKQVFFLKLLVQNSKNVNLEQKKHQENVLVDQKINYMQIAQQNFQDFKENYQKNVLKITLQFNFIINIGIIIN